MRKIGAVELASEVGSIAAVSIGTGANTTLATIKVSNFSEIYVEINNTDAERLDAFAIAVSADGSNYQTLYSVSGDYTSPSGDLVMTSGDLTILPATTVGFFKMEVGAYKSLQLAASGDTAASDVSVEWSAN